MPEATLAPQYRRGLSITKDPAREQSLNRKREQTWIALRTLDAPRQASIWSGAFSISRVRGKPALPFSRERATECGALATTGREQKAKGPGNRACGAFG
jgi:hypothetical protein